MPRARQKQSDAQSLHFFHPEKPCPLPSQIHLFPGLRPPHPPTVSTWTCRWAPPSGLDPRWVQPFPGSEVAADRVGLCHQVRRSHGRATFTAFTEGAPPLTDTCVSPRPSEPVVTDDDFKLVINERLREKL